MSARELPSFAVPTGFGELLKDFAREVLRSQPADVNAFAVEFFSQRISERQKQQQSPSPQQQQQQQSQPQSPAAVRTPKASAEETQPARSGVVSFTGARHTECEDASAVVEDVSAALSGADADAASALPAAMRGARAFVVCDGHGGTHSAQYVARELWKAVARADAAAAGDVQAALREAFAATDRRLEAVLEVQEAALPAGAAGSGACAVCAFVLADGTVHVANAGDSRCVVARRGGRAAEALSRDHKVADPDERRRIEALGGFVHADRLLGVLAVSRSFGDFEIKKAATDDAGRAVLVSDPDTRVLAVEPDDVCLILASDGLWDALDNAEAADLCLRALAESGGVPKRACEALVKAAVEAGSEDDITVLVAMLH